MRNALASTLTSRGLREVEESEADLIVSYDIGTFRAGNVVWAQQSSLLEGRLVVRGIDGKTGQEVWYGWVEARLKSSPDPEPRIPAAINALFDERASEN